MANERGDNQRQFDRVYKVDSQNEAYDDIHNSSFDPNLPNLQNHQFIQYGREQRKSDDSFNCIEMPKKGGFSKPKSRNYSKVRTRFNSKSRINSNDGSKYKQRNSAMTKYNDSSQDTDTIDMRSSRENIGTHVNSKSRINSNDGSKYKQRNSAMTKYNDSSQDTDTIDMRSSRENIGTHVNSKSRINTNDGSKYKQRNSAMTKYNDSSQDTDTIDMRSSRENIGTHVNSKSRINSNDGSKYKQRNSAMTKYNDSSQDTDTIDMRSSRENIGTHVNSKSIINTNDGSKYKQRNSAMTKYNDSSQDTDTIDSRTSRENICEVEFLRSIDESKDKVEFSVNESVKSSSKTTRRVRGNFQFYRCPAEIVCKTKKINTNVVIETDTARVDIDVKKPKKQKKNKHDSKLDQHKCESVDAGDFIRFDEIEASEIKTESSLIENITDTRITDDLEKKCSDSSDKLPSTSISDKVQKEEEHQEIHQDMFTDDNLEKDNKTCDIILARPKEEDESKCNRLVLDEIKDRVQENITDETNEINIVDATIVEETITPIYINREKNSSLAEHLSSFTTYNNSSTLNDINIPNRIENLEKNEIFLYYPIDNPFPSPEVVINTQILDDDVTHECDYVRLQYHDDDGIEEQNQQNGPSNERPDSDVNVDEYIERKISKLVSYSNTYTIKPSEVSVAKNESNQIKPREDESLIRNEILLLIDMHGPHYENHL